MPAQASERRVAISRVLRRLGYIAAAVAVLTHTENKWEDYYAGMLSNHWDDLSTEEQRTIYPWNFEKDDERCSSCGLMDIGGGHPAHTPDCAEDK
jgi:hypothetical protein